MAQPNYQRLADAFATASQERALLPNIPAISDNQNLMNLINQSHIMIIQHITTQIDGLRTEFGTEIGGLRTEFGTEIRGLRTEIGGLRTEFGTEIGGLRTELRNRFNAK